jgi:hypothetical protein
MEAAMRLMIVALAVVLVGWLPAVHAQPRPDFSGEWVLNRTMSSLPGDTYAALESGVVRIQHREPVFTFQRTFVVNKQALDASFEIQTDGREIAVASRGLTSRSRLEWQGTSLVLTALIKGPRGDISNIVRYELLDGGRVLRAIEDLGGAAPAHHNVWMYERR